MDEAKIEHIKKLALKIMTALYLLAILIPLVLRIIKARSLDSISIVLIIAMFVPVIISLTIKIIKIVSEKRSEIDLASDHIGSGGIFSVLSIKYILLAFGVLVGMGLLIFFIPAPWNLFVIFAAAYLIFASIRLL